MKYFLEKVSCILIVLNVLTFFILFHTYTISSKYDGIKGNTESFKTENFKRKCIPVYREVKIDVPCNISEKKNYDYKDKIGVYENNTEHLSNISYRFHTNDSEYLKISELSEKRSMEMISELKSLLSDLAKNLNTAKQHVRGVKTNEALMEAKETMMRTLKVIGLSWNDVTKRETYLSKSVCPEYFLGERKGYPLYQIGWSVKNCTYSKSLHSLISIVTVFRDQPLYQLYELITSIKHYNSQLSVFISIPKRLAAYVENSFAKTRQNLYFKIYNELDYPGAIWNDLISKVKTPYLLMARDLVWFDSDVRLERLIGQIERLNVVTAGGATRDGEGHWSLGCHQRALRNYTLVYEAGYDVSAEECIFCDHIDGPFVMETGIARRISLHDKIKGQGLFEEFFIRLRKGEHIVCPDCMFHVNASNRSSQPGDWKNLGDVLNVQRIIHSGTEIDLPCPSYTGQFDCNDNTTSRSICCMKDLSDLVVNAMSVCANSDVICELESGTLLSAVKLHSTLPWEVDADIFFLSNNYSALHSTKQTFEDLGFEMRIARPESSLKCCIGKPERLYDGYFELWSRIKNYRLEFSGMPYLSSEPNFMNGKSPTLLLYNGKWVRGPRNPGLVARNCYGSEIFQHSQHWAHTGELEYLKRFKKCDYKNYHACLDQYNVDGNLQFRNPIP